MSSVCPWEMKLFQADTSSHCYRGILFFAGTSFCLIWPPLSARGEGTTMRWRTFWTSTTSRWPTTPPATKRAKRWVGDTCALSDFCRLWALHIFFVISLPLRQSAEMPLWEMSASGFIAVISMSNKSRASLLCLAAVQGQLSLLFATCSSWWRFCLPLVGMCARGDLLMSRRFAPQMSSSHPAADCWFETDSVSQRLYVARKGVLWHVAVIVIQHVQFAALLLCTDVRDNRKLPTLFTSFILLGFTFTSKGFRNEWEVSSHTFVMTNKKMWKKRD